MNGNIIHELSSLQGLLTLGVPSSMPWHKAGRVKGRAVAHSALPFPVLHGCVCALAWKRPWFYATPCGWAQPGSRAQGKAGACTQSLACPACPEQAPARYNPNQ